MLPCELDRFHSWAADKKVLVFTSECNMWLHQLIATNITQHRNTTIHANRNNNSDTIQFDNVFNVFQVKLIESKIGRSTHNRLRKFITEEGRKTENLLTAGLQRLKELRGTFEAAKRRQTVGHTSGRDHLEV